MRSRIIGALVAFAALTAASWALAGGMPPINCTGGPCVGTPENDTMVGSPEADQIRALAGNDDIDGNNGNDRLGGGAGRDSTQGARGNDRHMGGRGRDQLSEFNSPQTGGEDVLLGGPDRDFLEGNEEGDLLRGGRGNERQPEASAPMRQRGSLAECYRDFCAAMFGDPGRDRLYGGRGHDHMEGEEGRDELYGGRGDDTLDAANDDTGAVDKLFCGPGRDLAIVGPEDVVADDCERVRPPASPPLPRSRSGR